MNDESAIRRLISAIEQLPSSKQPQRGIPDFVPEKLSPNWLWEELLLSFATLGRSQGGVKLFEDPNLWRKVEFDLLANMDRDTRSKHLENVFRQAGIRYPRRKAEQMARNVDLIVALGGPESVSEQALQQPGPQAKLRFVQQFVGIGPKYARNIWLDIRHPDLVDSIAIDRRLTNITKALGLSFATYEDHEAFYLEVARRMGVPGYELDRCLYREYRGILHALETMPALP